MGLGVIGKSRFVALLMCCVMAGNDQLVCVPSGCRGDSSEEECSETWQFQTDLCQQDVLDWPDTNFHYFQARGSSPAKYKDKTTRYHVKPLTRSELSKY